MSMKRPISIGSGLGEKGRFHGQHPKWQLVSYRETLHTILYRLCTSRVLRPVVYCRSYMSESILDQQEFNLLQYQERSCASVTLTKFHEVLELLFCYGWWFHSPEEVAQLRYEQCLVLVRSWWRPKLCQLNNGCS